MKKRSLFSKIFKTNKNVHIGTDLKFLNGYTASFTNFNGKLYDTISVRKCIDAIARNAAKLHPKHIRESENYEILKDNIYKLLSQKPNEIMNAYDFYYKIISILYLDNNSFIFIQRDEKGMPTGLYPIKSNCYKLLEFQNNIYIQFQFGSGKFYTASLQDDVIHLRRFYCNNDILGGDNVPITKTMSFKHILDEGIINAIKTTQGIKGVLKTTKAMLKPEDIKQTRDQFVKDFLNAHEDEGLGIAALDATTDFKPVDINPQTATESQINNVEKDIKDYYGVSDEIIQSKYNEDQWNAFYESVIEPLAIQMGLEFTNKLFSVGEQNHGNKIIFESNRLQYASNTSKIAVAKDLNNFFMIDEIREIFNMAPLPNGEGQKVMQDLNHIDNKIANQYQVGTQKTEETIKVEEDTNE